MMVDMPVRPMKSTNEPGPRTKQEENAVGLERASSGLSEDLMSAFLRQGSLGVPQGNGQQQGQLISEDLLLEDFMRRLPSINSGFLDGMDFSQTNHGTGEVDSSKLSKVPSLDVLRAYFTRQGSLSAMMKGETVAPPPLEGFEGSQPMAGGSAAAMMRGNLGGTGVGSTANMASLLRAHDMRKRNGDRRALNESTLSSSAFAYAGGAMPLAKGDMMLPDALPTCFASPQSPPTVPTSAIGLGSERSHTSSDNGNMHRGALAGSTQVKQQKDLARKERRMISNRESARRSRKRKQEHMNELEHKVQLLSEEYEVLKSKYDALQAKLSKREEELRRLVKENELLRKAKN